MRGLLFAALVLSIPSTLLADLYLSDIAALPLRHEGDLLSYADLNDHGVALGRTDHRPLTWDAAAGFAVYPILGWSTSGNAINNANRICGYYNSEGMTIACAGNSNSMNDLGSPLSGDRSHATGINDAGQVVGFSSPRGSPDSTAFFWDNGVVTEIHNGDARTWAHSINNSGQIAGITQAEGEYTHVFVWDRVSGLVEYSFDEWVGATAVINNCGQIVYRGYFIDGDEVIYAGEPWGTAFAFADLNDRGVAVGRGPIGDPSDDSIWQACMWTRETGVINLNDLLLDGAPWARLDRAVAINNSNQILGEGTLTNGETAYFIAQFVPEPTTVSLLGVGGVFLLQRRRSHSPIASLRNRLHRMPPASRNRISI